MQEPAFTFAHWLDFVSNHGTHPAEHPVISPRISLDCNNFHGLVTEQSSSAIGVRDLRSNQLTGSIPYQVSALVQLGYL